MKETPGDFSVVMADANRMANASIAHPFGTRAGGAGQNGRQALPVRQTTKMFYCPKQLDEYDELMNRAWQGDIEIRFEERFTTKEGEMVIVVCSFEQARGPQRLHEVPAQGDAEPEAKPQKLP